MQRTQEKRTNRLRCFFTKSTRIRTASGCQNISLQINRPVQNIATCCTTELASNLHYKMKQMLQALTRPCMADNSDKQQDIRQWLSSPGGQSNNTNPSRRRRVMSTSDSEEERTMLKRKPQAPQLQQRSATVQATANADFARDGHVVTVESSPEDHRADMGGAFEQQRQISGNQQRRTAACNNVPQMHAANNTHRTPHARQPQRRCRGRYVEASESSALTDSDSSCVESDTNARSQYRDAILGVRNANRARQQMRALTQSCPTCARFESFLQSFL